MPRSTGDGRITRDSADAALTLLDVDHRGFDRMDRRILLTIIEKFDGGPVGVDTLAAALCEERDTLEDVYEPFLIQCGFLTAPPGAGSPPAWPWNILTGSRRNPSSHPWNFKGSFEF